MKNVAVLVSGSGTNLQAIIDAIDRKEIPARICVVISSKRDVFALTRAEKAEIPSVAIPRKEYADFDLYFKDILDCLVSHNTDYIVLAGYLSILSPEIIDKYRNKIINIHPALIPSFCGKGFYGSRVHQAVLDYGVKVTGATVHFVNEVPDDGPIILQECVPVLDGDDVETLSKRVLEKEHKLLVQALMLLVTDRLEIRGRRVIIREEAIR
ncbi:MAG TPA: phosphoribosylglycinamide formyltransferase [Clostridia bacterium]|nr:phosphoribosylglycinamide formyltransferase [Clostridia bacterium]